MAHTGKLFSHESALFWNIKPCTNNTRGALHGERDVCVCGWVNVRACVYVGVEGDTERCVNVFLCVCACVFVCVLVCLYVHVRVYTKQNHNKKSTMYNNTNTYVHTDIYTHPLKHTRTSATHTQTHTYLQFETTFLHAQSDQ